MELGAMNIGTGNFDGSFLSLESGHVELGALSIGGANNSGKNARIDIAGQSSAVISGVFAIYDRQGTVVTISIPEDGYPAPLIQAGSLVAEANSSAPASSTSLMIDSRRWAKLHPKTELVLVELQQANFAGLNALAEQISFVGNGLAGVVVNDVGTRLSLKSAPKQGFTIFVR